MNPRTVEAMRQRMCEHKVRRTARGARENAVRRQAAGENVHPYKCIFCEHWHVGHPPSHRSVKKMAQVIRWRAYPEDDTKAAG